MTNKDAIVHIEEIRPKKCKMVNGGNRMTNVVKLIKAGDQSD